MTQEDHMHAIIRTAPGYDLDYSTMPDPTVPVAWEDFQQLEMSPDLLQRGAFWAFYVASNADVHNDPAIALAARQDGHALHTLGHDMHIKDRIIIRRSTIAENYVPRSTVKRNSLLLILITSIVTAMIYHYLTMAS